MAYGYEVEERAWKIGIAAGLIGMTITVIAMVVILWVVA